MAKTQTNLPVSRMGGGKAASLGVAPAPIPQLSIRCLLSPGHHAEHSYTLPSSERAIVRYTGILLLIIPILQMGSQELSDLTQVYVDRKWHGC